MKRNCLVALAILLAGVSVAMSAEVKIFSPVAMRPVLSKVAAELEQSTGNKVVVMWGESGGMRADIEKGVPFDVAILTSAFVDDLIRQSKLDGATRTVLARSGIGVAVPKGAPKPDVGSVEAFKRALLEAKSVGFVEGSASSRYLPGLFERLGIAEQLKSKLKPLPGPVHEFVGKGDPELALSQIAAIVPFDSIEFAGPLPPEIQLNTVFVAAASPSANADLAKALLRALASPSNSQVLRGAGLEPGS